MTLKDLYALMLAEYGSRLPEPDPVTLAVAGFRWVMDLGSYKEVRAVCRAAGAIYPEGDDPEGWVPDPADRLFGLLVDVREDGGAPHLERSR